MTNKEYLLKYFNEHEDLLSQTIDCAVCRAVGLADYCRATMGNTCEDTKEEWLSMERNPLNLKVGDIVQIETLPYNTELRYYIGSELNLMYFAKTLEEYKVGKKNGASLYPRKCELVTLHISVLEKNPNLVKKVGEVNDES